ncbi:MAG TPA: hydroxymethylbilane synthase [Anaerolineae bacterium]
MPRTILIGTRASALAQAQARQAMAALSALHPQRSFELRNITTHGDRVLDRALTEIGGKGVFVKEIEDALLAGDIDLAVHSFKDLPTEQPGGLVIGAIMTRADPCDVLVSRTGQRLAALAAGARVGTSSLRRSVQLLAVRPDLKPVDIRGNVDTRLRKLDEGQYDAIVLAAAGLTRLGLAARATEYFDPRVFLPAPGQGAVALELRSADTETQELVAGLDHVATHTAVSAERAFLSGLGGGCDLPIGAYAWPEAGDHLSLRAMNAERDGSHLVYVEASGPAAQADALGRGLARDVLGSRDG